MLRRAGVGCLGLVVVVGLVGYAAAVLPGLPWWSVLFGVLFWVALARRVRSRAAVGPLEGPADDGRTPFPIFRDKGF